MLARSQYISGLVGGIGMALHEETMTDTRNARIVGPNLTEYLIPIHADVQPIEIVMVDEIDDYLPEGLKGIGVLATLAARRRSPMPCAGQPAGASGTYLSESTTCYDDWRIEICADVPGYSASRIERDAGIRANIAE